MNFSTKHNLINFLNPISLADIILLLLIFFLLSSTFVMVSGVKVKLPESTSEKVPKEKQIFITITKDGKLFFNDSRVTENGLKRALIEAGLPADNEQLVTFRCDQDVPLKDLVRIMDIVKFYGGKKFFIATQSLTR